jgi:hypothetical protein
MVGDYYNIDSLINESFGIFLVLEIICTIDPTDARDLDDALSVK